MKPTPKRSSQLDVVEEIPLTPMIDCVFLLLIYFIASSSIQVIEHQHVVQLPGEAASALLPDELILEFVDGNLILNQSLLGKAQDQDWPALRQLLLELAPITHAANRTPLIVIQPEPSTLHDSIARLVALCHHCGYTQLTFTLH